MFLYMNELTSIILMDFMTSLTKSYVVDNLIHKPKTIQLGYASAILRKWKQMSLYDDTRDREGQVIAPDLPILSVIPQELQPDNSPFAWHKLTLPKLQRRFSLCLLKTDKFVIKYVPYLYTLRFSIVFVGRSFADVTDAQILLEEMFGTRHVIPFEMQSVLTFPKEVFTNIFDQQSLQTITQYIPLAVVPLLAQERYVAPYKLNVQIKNTSIGTQSQLFGETGLPDYSIQADFEAYLTLPTRFIINYRGIIKEIRLNVIGKGKAVSDTTANSNNSQQTNDNVVVLESNSLELDPETGSYIIHTILKANG